MAVIFETDAEGFLLDLSIWNKEIAFQLALADHVTINDKHWEIILLLRWFYHEYQLHPSRRVFSKIIREKLGDDKASSLYLLTLFPDGALKQAAKFAGLPKPPHCT